MDNYCAKRIIRTKYTKNNGLFIILSQNNAPLIAHSTAAAIVSNPKKVQTEACTFEVLHILLGRRPLTAGCYSLENAAAPFVISQRYNSTAAAASTTAQIARYSDSPS